MAALAEAAACIVLLLSLGLLFDFRCEVKLEKDVGA